MPNLRREEGVTVLGSGTRVDWIDTGQANLSSGTAIAARDFTVTITSPTMPIDDGRRRWAHLVDGGLGTSLV